MKKLFTLVMLLSMVSFAQNGIRLLDYNAKSLGRGGTSIGIFDAGSLMQTNPGGISFTPGSYLDVNYSALVPTVHFKNGINDKDGDNLLFHLPSLSYVKQVSPKVTLGAGLYTTGGLGADYTMNHALFVDNTGKYIPQEYHSKLAVMQAGISAAYRVTENLSVGVTVDAVYSMLEFSMPYSLDPMIMKGTAMPGMTFGQVFSAPSSMGGFGYDEVTAAAKMTDLTAIGVNGKLGIAYKPSNELSLGLSFTTPTKLSYKNGKAKMDMTAQLNNAFGKAVMGYMQQNPTATQAQAQAAIMAQFSGMGIDMTKGVAANYDLTVDLTTPMTIGFGVAYKPMPALNLAADFEWLNWENAFDKMVINLSKGDNSNINKMMGNDGTFSLDFPMNWKNTIMVKLGAEYMVNPMFTVRAGYAYGQNPVPSSTVFSVFPAIVENHVTLGLGVNLMKNLEMNLAYEASLKNEQTGDANHIVANEYNNSTSSLACNFAHIAFTYKF